MNQRRGVGRTRHKMAEALYKLLRDRHKNPNHFTGEHLIPTTGKGRSDPNVPRWSTKLIKVWPLGETTHHITVFSHTSMTDLLRSNAPLKLVQDPEDKRFYELRLDLF